MNFIQQYHFLKEKYPPKLICKAITRNAGLWSHICEETAQYTDLSVPERVYLWEHQISPYCQHNNKRSFNTLEKGYRQFCGPRNKCQCSREHHSEKLKENWQQQDKEATAVRFEKMQQTTLERYGCTNAAKAKEVKEKIKATNLERYGAESPFASAIIKEKIKTTNLERYGVESPFQSKEILEKALTTQQEKHGGLMVAARAKLFKKYGGNPFAHPDIQNKIRNSTVKNHGVEYYSKTDEYKTKVKQTKKARYGDENYNNLEKAKRTCLEKYGVRNPGVLTENSQNPNLIVLRDKEKLLELFPALSVEEIASKLEVHIVTVYKYLAIHDLRDKYRSSFEKEIVLFLESLGVSNIVCNSKQVIPPKEIDIFLPDYNIAIEFNGLFWHHDGHERIDPLYHYRKFKECEAKGILLLSIFSHSWDTKKDIWKAKIRHKLNHSDAPKVFARQTQVVQLTTKESRPFLDKNHIQGYCVTPFQYGLKYKGELVAVMTFSRKRAGIGGKNKNACWFELVRYATSCSVVGGASKLLKHFIKTQHPTTITSYSDNEYSTGGMYQKLGFSLTNETKAGYFYFHPSTGEIKNRFSMAKFKLVEQGHDPNKTEREITAGLGYLRIWDCGTRTWVLHL